jgi:hypothetical protein
MLASLKSLKILTLLSLTILLFQSFGGGLLSYNFTIRHSFTDGLMAFWRPVFIFQAWTNLLYIPYSIGYCVLLFYFVRKVEIESWQMIFLLVVMVVFAKIGYVYAVYKFRDMLIPIMLLTALRGKE